MPTNDHDKQKPITRTKTNTGGGLQPQADA